MAIDAPAGYVTRPTAAKLYNRSQRSLERDLEEAYKQQSEEVLSAFKLATNDDRIRDAQEVTTALVETLKQDGRNPAWCVRTAWLEERFGKKGSPKPTPSIEQAPAAQPMHEEPSRGQPPTAQTGDTPLPNDVEFLKERIRALEREKQQEIERNQKREDEFFKQLDVKDKQISAWDEITQGITKGLATGTLAPALPRPAQATENKATPLTEPIEVKPQPVPPKRKTTAAKKKTPSKKPAPRKSAKKKAPAKNWLNRPIGEFFSRS